MNSLALSVIIVSYNTRDVLRECLDALFKKLDGLAFEVIVVDNASHDGSPGMVREAFPQAHVIELDDNVGFGAGNNVGVQAARGQYLFLLNSDAILLENTPLPLVQYLQQHAEVACVGPRIVQSDRNTQPRAFGHLPSPWRILMQSLGLGYLGMRMLEGVDGRKRVPDEMQVGWLSGVCLCLRREDYLAVGGFDPRFFMYAEDVALCGRLQREKGKILLVDRYDVLHYGGASSPNLDSRTRNAVWQQRHILQVCEDEFGPIARNLSVLFVAAGLCLRLAAALLLIPKHGIRANPGLKVNWARLCDLGGRTAVPIKKTVRNGEGTCA